MECVKLTVVSEGRRPEAHSPAQQFFVPCWRSDHLIGHQQEVRLSFRFCDQPTPPPRPLPIDSFPLFADLFDDIRGHVLLCAPISVQILLSLSSPFFFDHHFRPKVPLSSLTKAICEEGHSTLIPFALSLGLSFSSDD